LTFLLHPRGLLPIASFQRCIHIRRADSSCSCSRFARCRTQPASRHFARSPHRLASRDDRQSPELWIAPDPCIVCSRHFRIKDVQRTIANPRPIDERIASFPRSGPDVQAAPLQRCSTRQYFARPSSTKAPSADEIVIRAVQRSNHALLVVVRSDHDAVQEQRGRVQQPLRRFNALTTTLPRVGEAIVVYRSRNCRRKRTLSLTRSRAALSVRALNRRSGCWPRPRCSPAPLRRLLPTTITHDLAPAQRGIRSRRQDGAVLGRRRRAKYFRVLSSVLRARMHV